MPDFAIRAEGLCKRYRIGERVPYQTLRDTLARAVSSGLDRLRPAGDGDGRAGGGAPDTIWALRDVSFTVGRGEVVGVIGRNGAGKSTLLKILSRITEPTEGYADIAGRVGSLLEVGTGFHPELTGRENTYLNGAILGMERREIDRKFDEIVAFSGVAPFIDTPVKRYSSGMYLRLAFAVAAHLETEILLVDEVLAVGDAAFQRKCLGKMGDVARAGRTVLFVSHNMPAVRKLCRRAIWLEEGRVVRDGDADAVAAAYLSEGMERTLSRSWADPADAPGNEAVRLRAARVVAERDGAAAEAIDVTTPLRLEFEYWNLAPGTKLNLSVVVYNEEGAPLFNTVPVHEPEWHRKPFPGGLFRSVCRIPGSLLNDGVHRVQLYVVRDESVVLSRHDDLLVFDVADAPEQRGAWFGKWIGAVRPELEWRTERLSSAVGAVPGGGDDDAG